MQTIGKHVTGKLGGFACERGREGKRYSMCEDEREKVRLGK